MTGNRVKTATQRAQLPVKHGHGTGVIATDDDALVLEALRIAENALLHEAAGCERMMPRSFLVERLRVFAEQMRELRERMDA